MKYPAYQISIPSSVRFDKSLSANVKLLYGEIKALCDQQGYCWASNHHFATLYGVKKETVSFWLKQLKERGLIQVLLNEMQGNQRQIFLQNLPLEDYDKSEEGKGQNGRGLPISSPPSSELTHDEKPLHLINNIIDYNDRIHSVPLPNLSINRNENKRQEETSKVANSEEPFSHEITGQSTSPPVAAAPPPKQIAAIKKFIKPSVSEVEEYMKSQSELCPDSLIARGQALRFVNYYEANGWKVGRNDMQDWQAAANNWLLNAKDYANQASKLSRNDISSPNFDPYASRLHTGGRQDYSIPL